MRLIVFNIVYFVDVFVLKFYGNVQIQIIVHKHNIQELH